MLKTVFSKEHSQNKQAISIGRQAIFKNELKSDKLYQIKS